MLTGFFEDLESRTMFSVFVSPSAVAANGPEVTRAIHVSVKVARPPTARLTAKPITSAISSETLKVVYHSSAGINTSTIATGNVTVSGPNGYSSTPTLVSIAPGTNTRTVVAVYSAAPPSGITFTAADNGVYIVTLAAGSVADVNNLSTAVAAKVGVFKSQIKIVPPPTGKWKMKAKAKVITSAVSSYPLVVVYHGSASINSSTIATGNVVVSGPNGYTNAATLVSISPAGNSRTIIATYSVTPPAGSTFGPGDNGLYSISLAAGSVMNTNGISAAAATLGTFSVNILASTGSLPNMIGTYNGTNIVASAGSYHYVQMTVANEDASGNISGSWVTDVGVAFNFTGTVASDGTFTYTFATGPNTNHATGPVSGSGTGMGGGTKALAMNFTATSQGFSAPGTMNVTRA